MFEGTRLSYLVPGYTGHIPKIHHQQQYVETKPENHIPKYQGYIKSIQSENIFGKTYGKTTYEIQHNDFHQGQDLPPQIRYKSHMQDIYCNQKNVQLRTAAQIVGVPNKQYIYEIQPGQTLPEFQNQNSSQQQQNQPKQIDEKDPLRLGTPLPGYTGTQKRIVASNIFGQTFANARKSALEDEEKIQNDRRQNFIQQTQNIPPLKR